MSDIFCGSNCNPLLYPQLYKDGKWIFNSSAAEQANSWIVRFRAVVRDMLKHNFNFFLDEMIRLRNEAMVEKLVRLKMNPYRRNEVFQDAFDSVSQDNEDQAV